MSKLLENRIALITGASRGIGRALAQRLAAEGATVVVTARSLDSAGKYEGTLKETVGLIEAAGGTAYPLVADLEKDADLDSLVPRAVDLAGGLDILVHSGGKAEYAPTVDMETDVFDRTLGHYLRAPFRLYRHAVPEMRRRGAGWIVTLGSVTALPPLRPYDEWAMHGGATVYAALKAAVHRMTQGLAAELLPREPANTFRRTTRPSVSSTSPRPAWPCVTCPPANGRGSQPTACIFRIFINCRFTRWTGKSVSRMRCCLNTHTRILTHRAWAASNCQDPLISVRELLTRDGVLRDDYN